MPEPLSVFLCHASQDKPIVRELYQRLKAEGWIDPWLDEEKLSPGQVWTSTIEEAIDSAGSVIIFLSKNSVSKEGFVQRELRRAWKRSTEKPENVIFLIPFRLDDCEVPRRLRTIQWADYFGEKKEKTYNDLLVSLKQRHKQKLLLDEKEQARAEELIRIQEEEEVFRKQVQEELARRRQEKEKSAFALSKSAGSSILIDGNFVHFEALGRGRPIIYLHTWIGSWRYWLNSMQATSHSFRSYALDLFGFGDSSHNPKHYSIDQQATMIHRFMEEMGIGKIALIGHGLGALVGLSFIKQWPTSVDRMMAISCPLRFEDIHRRLGTASTSELEEWLSNRSPEAEYLLSDASKADPVVVSTSMADLREHKYFNEIRNLGIPCLFVYGSLDPSMRISAGHDENSLPGHMHQIDLEDSGHFPMLDHSLQFNDLLIDFLALDSGLSPRELSE